MKNGMILFAEVEEKPANPGEKKEGENPFGSFIVFIPIIILAYFLLIVPARRERQQKQQLWNSLKKDDEVITSAGIIGRVTSIKDKENEVTIKSEETKIRVLRSSIVQIVAAKEQPKETT